MRIGRSLAKWHSEIQDYWRRWQHIVARFAGVAARELIKKRSEFLWDRHHPEDDNGTYDQAGWKFGLMKNERGVRLPPSGDSLNS